MTNGDGILRQTIYYPYATALKYARGRALSIETEGPQYEVGTLGHTIETNGADERGFGEVNFVDIAATLDPESKAATLFLLNRDLEMPQEVDLVWRDLTPAAVHSFQTITGPDLKAVNTFTDPNRVTPQTLESPKPASRMSLQLPARSYSVLSVAL